MAEYSLAERRAQVIEQCRVVAHLAQVMVELHTDMMKVYAEPASDPILDMGGDRTARIMEFLGDELSNMDAVEEEDAWTDKVFERAHAMYPQQPDGIAKALGAQDHD